MIDERLLTATYRLQLHEKFGFAQVREIAEYLHRLGISHVYSSPILRARPGSTHGYDVADPTLPNPELGGDGERIAMIDALHDRDLGLILDIVPNHMGTGPSNPYWQDVLTHGRSSAYAKWFDVEWEAPSRTAPGRLLLPVLGDERDSALARGELGLAWEDGALVVTYFDERFPTDPATIPEVVREIENDATAPGDDRAALNTILADLGRLPAHDAAATATPRRRAADRALQRLRALAGRAPGVREHLERSATEHARGPQGAERMRRFLDAQPYRLRFWRLAPRDLNYRRFFDINELVALRMEDPEVFAETHELILRWIADRSLDGIRIDHIDGLLDPRRYLERLRAAIRARRPDGEAEFPIFVEKILSPGEKLREEWPVEGTTGYEFLNDLEAILIEPVGHAVISRFYAGLTGLPDFAQLAYRGKSRVLQGSLASDVGRLARLLWPLAEQGRRTSGLGRTDLRGAIIELIAHLPVYRTYIDPETGQFTRDDRAVIERAARRTIESGRVALAAVELLRHVMLEPDRAIVGPGALELTDDIDVPDEPGAGDDEPSDVRKQALDFVAHFQQTSGPATAKGVEDTALYQHYPLASLNEVGGEPERPLDRAVALLHEANAERSRRWPHALVCTNTHDAKRSADVRARLHVLSELPDRWESAVLRWRRLNRTLRTRVRDRMAPDANTEYLLYQTLVGVWPLPGATSDPEEAELLVLRDRVAEYMLKASREAKRHTSWTDPDSAFEDALRSFVERIFEAGRASEFLREIEDLVREIARPGMWNALSRALVHLTVPGTPDTYQGDELWSFSLVDPDNRRPVDYEQRSRMLSELEAAVRGAGTTPVELVRDMAAHPEDGRIKLFTAWRALHCRREHPDVFRNGRYEVLEADGPSADHVFAFGRVADGDAAVVLATRLPYGMTGAIAAPVGRSVWGGTRVRLPARPDARRWRCQLNGVDVEPKPETQGGPWIEVGEALANLPVALLFPA